MGRLIKNIIVTFLMIIFCAALPSYSAGFSLDYSIGFNGHFQLNNWTPLSVVLDNRSRATSGNLEVIVTSGSEYQGDVYRNFYSTRVDLPQNSQKRYSFTIMIKSFSHDLLIRLRQGKNIVFSQAINLRSHFTEKNFAVVADNYVTPDILSVLPNHLYPANIRPNFLPETWYGYSSVKLLLLRADTIGQLRNRQYQALVQWLKQGGYLVVGTGLNYGFLADKMLQDILPIRAAGHQEFFELKSLGQFCSRELSGFKPFLVLNARIDDSKILVSEGDIAIITQKNFGTGHVVFLSFDYNAPPFSHWDGRRMFWNKILFLQPKTEKPAVEFDDQQIVSTMLAGIPLKWPGFRSIIIYVSVYLLFLWFFLNKIKRPGKGRWPYSLCLILMIALFTAVGYWGFYYPNQQQNFSYNSFCQVDVSDPAHPASARFYIGLYSLKKLAYELNFGSHFYPVSHIISEKSNVKIPNPYIVQKKDNGQYITGSIKRWSHNFFKLKLHLTSVLSGYARRDKSFMSLTVENKSSHNLVDCLIYFRKRFISVEDILARNRQTIKIDLAKLKKKEIFGEHEIDRAIRRLEDNGSAAYLRKIQRDLSSDLLLGIHNKYKSRADSMLLVGWMQADLIQPIFKKHSPQGVGVTMISWEIPVEITL